MTLHEESRWRRMGAGICLGLFLVCTALYSVFQTTGETRHSIQGWDEQHYYAYARSLAMDGDLDFANEYAYFYNNPFAADQPDEISKRTATGLVPNRYAVGMGLLLAPTIWLGHAATWIANVVLGRQLPYDGYSACYTYLYSLANILIGWIGIALSWRLAARFAGERAAALALPVVLLGTSLFAYCTIQAPNPHTTNVGLAGVYFWWLVRSDAARSKRATFGLGCLNGFMAAVRYTDVVMGAAYAVREFIRMVSSRPRERVRILFARAPHWTLYAVGGFLGAAPQLIAWKRLYGAFFVDSYEGQGFDWLRPELLNTLFSTRNSLFVYAPVVLLCAIGLVVAGMRGQAKWSLSLSAPWLALWYINSAWCIWWFGASFGARAMLACWPVWLIGFAWLIERVLGSDAARAAWRRAGLLAAASAVCVAWTVLMAVLYFSGRIGHETGFTGEELLKALGEVAAYVLP